MYSRQVQVFVRAAERGSFSMATEDLYVTPASVMKQINALENRLGLTLFRRTNQGVELTEAGQYLYGAAKPSWPNPMRRSKKPKPSSDGRPRPSGWGRPF